MMSRLLIDLQLPIDLRPSIDQLLQLEAQINAKDLDATNRNSSNLNKISKAKANLQPKVEPVNIPNFIYIQLWFRYILNKLLKGPFSSETEEIDRIDLISVF